MANIQEDSTWASKIYALEYANPLLGGTPVIENGTPKGGYANIPFKQLAGRFNYLNNGADLVTTSLSALDIEVEGAVQTFDNHLSDNSYAHPLVTQVSNGFLSQTDKIKLDNLTDVATDGNYLSLENRPTFNYTWVDTSFYGIKGGRYYAAVSLVMYLPIPNDAGLVAGDFITVNKSPGSIVTVDGRGTNIITEAGSTNIVFYDVEEEITLFYDGTNWRV